MSEPMLPSKSAPGSVIFLSRWQQAPLYLGLMSHVTFVGSAIALAWIDRLTFKAADKGH